MMKLRQMDLDADYPMIAGWCTARGKTAPAKGIFPPIGVIVEVDGEPVVTGSMYLAAGMKLAFVTWVITNPTFKAGRVVREAVAHLLRCLEADAATMERTFLLSFVPDGSGLQHAYEHAGWGVAVGGAHVPMCKSAAVEVPSWS